MLIKKGKLSKIINTTLEFMNERKINSIGDLAQYVGQPYHPDPSKKDEFIGVEERPSNHGTTTLSLSYKCQSRLRPLDIRINPQLNYSKIIIAFNRTLAGYTPFVQDTSGNTAQEKKLTTDIKEIKEQLQQLLNTI